MENVIFDNHTTLSYVANVATCVAGDMHHIHIHASGEDFDTLHNIAMEYYEHAGADADTLMELAMECGEPVDNPNCASANIEWVNAVESTYNMDTAITAMETILLRYLTALCSLGELPQHVQNTIDDIVSYWSKEVYYKNYQRSVDSPEQAIDATPAESSTEALPLEAGDSIAVTI